MKGEAGPSSSSARLKSGVLPSEMREEEQFIEDGNLAASCVPVKAIRDDEQLAAGQLASNLITLDTASAEQEAKSVEVVSGSPKEGDDAHLTAGQGDVDPSIDEQPDEEALESKEEGPRNEGLEGESEGGIVASLQLDEARRIRDEVRRQREIRRRIAETKRRRFLKSEPWTPI